MSHSAFTQPSAWVPLAMSLAALCIVVGHITMLGSMHEADEGAAAHLFQLLVAGQVPFIAFFAIKWIKQAPKCAWSILGLQALAVAMACAPVWYFKL